MIKYGWIGQLVGAWLIVGGSVGGAAPVTAVPGAENTSTWQATLMVRNGEAVKTSKLSWSFKGNDVTQFRLEESRGTRQHVVIYNGKEIFEFLEGGKDAMPRGGDVSEVWHLTPWFSFGTIYEGDAQVKVVGEERVEGRMCEIRLITWATEESVPCKEWVWKGTNLVMKRESEFKGEPIVTALQGVVEMGPTTVSLFALPRGMPVIKFLKRGADRSVVVGQPLLEATLRVIGTERKGMSLFGALKGQKALVLNFFATWCGPCEKETPLLVKTYERYRKQGVTFLSVDVGERMAGDPDPVVAEFVKKHGITWPILLDEEFYVPHYVWGIPTSLVVDARGIIRAYWVDGGEVGFEEWLDEALEEILQGKRRI